MGSPKSTATSNYTAAAVFPRNYEAVLWSRYEMAESSNSSIISKSPIPLWELQLEGDTSGTTSSNECHRTFVRVRQNFGGWKANHIGDARHCKNCQKWTYESAKWRGILFNCYITKLKFISWTPQSYRVSEGRRRNTPVLLQVTMLIIQRSTTDELCNTDELSMRL